MTSLYLGNTRKGHITLLPAVCLTTKDAWEGTEGSQEVKYLRSLL
jgi:hypothetical protein